MSTQARGESRRTFLADMGMGFTGAGPGRDAAPRRHRAGRRRRPGGWAPPDGKPHFAPKAKNVIWLFMIGGTSHLESFDPKPAAEPVRGQDDRRDAVRRRASTTKLTENVREAWCRMTPTATSARSLYPLQVGYRQARAVRDRGQRLVAARGRLHRRHRRRPLDVDDRQRPRRPAAVPHRPAHARRASSRRSARGSTTASARSTTTCRSSSSWARRSPTAAAAWAATAPATSAPSTTASSSPSIPRTRSPSPRPAREVFREEQAGEFELLGRLNRLSARQVSRRPGAPRPDQVVRAGLPHADRRARGPPVRRRDAGAPHGSTGWTTT